MNSFDRLRPLSYPCTDIVLMCFSVMNHSSFKNVKSKWIREVRFHLRDVPIILIGCKIDLRSSSCAGGGGKVNHESSIQFEEGEELAREMGCITYWETSSFSGKGF